MNIRADGIAAVILIILWIAGVVVAKGFADVLFAIIIPFYAWYLIVERLMVFYGIV